MSAQNAHVAQATAAWHRLLHAAEVADGARPSADQLDELVAAARDEARWSAALPPGSPPLPNPPGDESHATTAQRAGFTAWVADRILTRTRARLAARGRGQGLPALRRRVTALSQLATTSARRAEALAAAEATASWAAEQAALAARARGLGRLPDELVACDLALEATTYAAIADAVADPTAARALSAQLRCAALDLPCSDTTTTAADDTSAPRPPSPPPSASDETPPSDA